MKKRLLFVTLYLQTGGVEKSLLSVLSTLDYDKYEVDLCLFDHSGVLFEYIPPQVNVLPPLFEHFSTPLLQSIRYLLKDRKFNILITKLLVAIVAKLSKGVGTGSRWAIYRRVLPKLQKHYDVAISYLDFFCNYYVAEKVSADRKIVYNHMDYSDGQKSGWPCPELERKSFSVSDYIVSVAESAKQSLIAFFPEIKNKIRVIHNTVSKETIENLAEQSVPEEYKVKDFNILTVARLVEEKGVFLALEACKLLVDFGMDFKWYFIGKGQLKGELEMKAKNMGLQDNFILLGEKANPYPYMANCDLYIQPSKTEAHCVAVEEAIALRRPMITTDIPSFQNQIMNGKTGIMVKADPAGIAEGIKRLFESPELRMDLMAQLENETERNKQELSKLYQLIEGNIAYSTHRVSF